MERAFLFGLGTFLIVAALAGLIRLSIPVSIFALVVMPISVFVLHEAIHAPPNRSRASTIGGWLLGFLVVPVPLCIAVFLTWFLS
jgi:hypothetical protein